MSYKFLMTINFFEAQRAQELLEENGLKSKLEYPYHFNLTAGWVDPFCNNNERNLFVLDDDFEKAKEILSNNFN